MGNIIRFEERLPAKPYPYKGVELQFYELIESMTEYKTTVKEDGTTEQVAVAWYYRQDNLPWRTEFEIKAEWDEEGNPIKKSYIDENYETLLEEAKQI